MIWVKSILIIFGSIDLQEPNPLENGTVELYCKPVPSLCFHEGEMLTNQADYLFVRIVHSKISTPRVLNDGVLSNKCSHKFPSTQKVKILGSLVDRSRSRYQSCSRYLASSPNPKTSK
jgi:hypothetical protein